MLIRLVYASTLRPGIEDPQIDEIMSQAQESNARQGVTGISAFDGGKVIQILEGPPDEIDHLYDKICHDGRHEGVVTLHRAPIETRHFPELTMARRPMTDVLYLVDRLAN
jgi:hypothetical protein